MAGCTCSFPSRNCKECRSVGGISLVWPTEIKLGDYTINEGKTCLTCGASLAGISIPLRITIMGRDGKEIDITLCLSCATSLKESFDSVKWTNMDA